MVRKISVALRTLRDGGPKALANKSFNYFQNHFSNTARINFELVSSEDILRADWTRLKRVAPVKKAAPYVLHWVIPPSASKSSGGHGNILRFVRFMEAHGHTCKVFVYDPKHSQTSKEAIEIFKHNFPPMKADVRHGVEGIEDCDGLIATAWQTAYPVFNAATQAKKFYFVQDFEPLFYPVGTESILAENTYRFGFYGITAGKWLTKKTAEYGMQSDYFDFGSDFGRYQYKNEKHRKKIFFYARPVTARRGFELGVLALEQFHREHPEYELNFAGWDVGHYKLPFPFVNHGALDLDELNQLYNDCAAALVLSLTNMSLLPLELLSAGCIPVVNEGDNNRLVSANKHIHYTPPSPTALANELSKIVERPDLPEYARAASASVEALKWEESGKKVNAIITRELNG